MSTEVQSTLENHTWDIVERLEDREVKIRSRFVLRDKHDSDGKLKRRKVRNVAVFHSDPELTSRKITHWSLASSQFY